MVNCVVIDDERPARMVIENFIARLPQLKLIGSYNNALLAKKDIENNKVDLLFLDIQMPKINGIDFLKTLTNQPLVIFTTAYSDFALEGYEYNSVDYLLKPIGVDRFNKAVLKAESILNQNETEEYINIKADQRIHKVFTKDIKYIEGLREYVKIYCKNDKLVSLLSLKKLEDDLNENFIRVHKSFIINTKYVTSYSSSEIEINGTKIPIGKSYRKSVLEKLL